MTTVAVALGDDVYEVNVASFYPEEAPTLEYPGAGAEVDLGAVVRFGKTLISLDEFTVLYAEYHSLASADHAMCELLEEVADSIINQRSEDFDDSDDDD